ncbi:hypothetical protein [Aminipila terrae]|uniref:Bypass of forespore C C-terminal domain-containing protein n=1 Tax=Aminipila terrae TaxID=2697030 RepID=A0A6P1MKS9_9FIRM|nr:hypothetical protein [Aminipila terrae]QHI73753.1 hypothetical protein Ami3637_16420 [Aminipila terrae]
MFTRKKSLVKRKEFYITLVAILGVGYLMCSLLISPKETPESENISTNVNQTVKQSNDKPDDEKNDVSEINDEDSDNNVQENQSGEYYLVKESDGIIKVYQYDENGKESLLRTTDIVFSMLSEDDQELFSKGVVVKTESELLDLLQDFES